MIPSVSFENPTQVFLNPRFLYIFLLRFGMFSWVAQVVYRYRPGVSKVYSENNIGNEFTATAKM